MKTEVLVIDPTDTNLVNHPGIIKGGNILRAGGLVAFPTETVYGLGANGLDPTAVAGIYTAKGRPSDNPLILHIAEINDLAGLTKHVPEQAGILMRHFWPGPLTLVFEKSPQVPMQVTGGLNTVAIRMPKHPVARALIAAAGVPVAAPSANRSGKPSPTLVDHVIEDLAGRVELIIDGGPCQMGIESTVLDISGKVPVLLRPGGVAYEDLNALLGHVELDSGVASAAGQAKELAPRSPGMKYRHYSPEAPLIIIEGEWGRVKSKFIEMIQASEGKLGILVSEETVTALSGHLAGVTVKVLGSRANPALAAERLFKLLREFDEEEVNLIIAEGLPLQGLGLAVMNRLRKAAGYKIITA